MGDDATKDRVVGHSDLLASVGSATCITSIPYIKMGIKYGNTVFMAKWQSVFEF